MQEILLALKQTPSVWLLLTFLENKKKNYFELVMERKKVFVEADDQKRVRR